MTDVVEPVVDRKRLARRLLLEKGILDDLQDRNAKSRDLAKTLYDGQEADSPKLGDVPLGRVYREKDRESCSIAETDEYVAWVEVNDPDQINEKSEWAATPEGVAYLREHRPDLVEEVVVKSVWPAYTRKLVAAFKKAKGVWPWTWVDPETGEESTEKPPWITYSSRPGNLVVNPSEEVPALVESLLADRLPEIEP